MYISIYIHICALRVDSEDSLASVTSNSEIGKNKFSPNLDKKFKGDERDDLTYPRGKTGRGEDIIDLLSLENNLKVGLFSYRKYGGTDTDHTTTDRHKITNSDSSHPTSRVYEYSGSNNADTINVTSIILGEKMIFRNFFVLFEIP
jgi:hypothetical protein